MLALQWQRTEQTSVFYCSSWNRVISKQNCGYAQKTGSIMSIMVGKQSFMGLTLSICVINISPSRKALVPDWERPQNKKPTKSLTVSNYVNTVRVQNYKHFELECLYSWQKCTSSLCMNFKIFSGYFLLSYFIVHMCVTHWLQNMELLKEFSILYVSSWGCPTLRIECVEARTFDTAFFLIHFLL